MRFQHFGDFAEYEIETTRRIDIFLRQGQDDLHSTSFCMGRKVLNTKLQLGTAKKFLKPRL